MRWWLSRWLGLGPPRGRALGRLGERLAARTLRRAGFRVVATNVRHGADEVDLIAVDRDERTIVFVEVKTRLAHEATGRPTYAPEVNIDARKAKAMARAARGIAAARGWAGRPLRIDVVAVEWSRAGAHEVRHHRGVSG